MGKGAISNDVDFSHGSSLAEDVGGREGLGDANVLMVLWPPIDPELLGWARRQGVLVVGDQVWRTQYGIHESLFGGVGRLAGLGENI